MRLIGFFRWLENYEYMTKKEFKELPKYKQENYIREFRMFGKFYKSKK